MCACVHVCVCVCVCVCVLDKQSSEGGVLPFRLAFPAMGDLSTVVQKIVLSLFHSHA